MINDTSVVSVQVCDTSDFFGPVFTWQHAGNNHLTFKCDDNHIAHVYILEEDIIRVMVLPNAEQHVSNTWAVVAGAEDVAYEGREKEDLSPFTLPEYQLHAEGDIVHIATPKIKLAINLKGFFCHWSVLTHSGWQDAAQDRPTQSYNFNFWDHRVYHYLKRSSDEMYFGLGEKSGEANRHGKLYRMMNTDAAYYNANTSDPLYKHFPFYLTVNKNTQATFGIFYDTYSDCLFDMGKEMDDYNGFFRSFIAETGDLDYYFIAGLDNSEVVKRFTWLTGKPVFPPKWSLGYSGSTMTYTDAPNAQERMGEFLDRCEQHDILCDSFHLSSGYTSIDGKRYVFNWNTDKFPDAKAFIQHYRDHGVRLVANIKPALLTSHPLYQAVAAEGLFVRNAKDTALELPFWGGKASYVDFTRPEAIQWWKTSITSALLDYGIASMWNDNNEFEVKDARSTSCYFGQKVAGHTIKPLQTLMMLKASFEAQKEYQPEVRQFSVSRAGVAGMQRYVQTWSGDNYTSWETLKFNIRMGTGLAMSGMSNTGHDVGGFFGPVPDPELFMRWIQFGVFLPRFSIHSCNSEGESVTEPWMYPEITPQIREMIKLRYSLLPYYYHLLWRSHQYFEPIMRPTYYSYPGDQNCYAENDEMMIGDSLLIAAVVEPGQTTRTLYLPQGDSWVDFWRGEHYAGGQQVTLPAPWDKPVVLVRAGSALPLNVAEQHFNARRDERGFMIFPHKGCGEFTARCYEDDGETYGYQQGRCGEWQLHVSSSESQIEVEIAFAGDQQFKSEQLIVKLPAGETRPLVVRNKKAEWQKDHWSITC